MSKMNFLLVTVLTLYIFIVQRRKISKSCATYRKKTQYIFTTNKSGDILTRNRT